MAGSTLETPRGRLARPLGAGLLLAVAYVGFVSLGLPDPVAGVAWPSVRDTFALPQSGLGLVFVALGVGSFASGFFSGKLTNVLGLGNLLWLSSALVAVAMLGCAVAPVWPLFVFCGVLWGLGSGGIDAGLNNYVAAHFSARHVNWLHACYNVGATLGPVLMTAMLVREGSWRLGYGLVGGLLAAMAVLFALTRHRWSTPPTVPTDGTPTDGAPTDPDASPVGLRTALRNRLVWLQIALFFLYVGLEFTVGQWSYTLLTESRAVSPDLAGLLAGGYYAAIGVGRVVSGAVTSRIGLDPLLRLSLLVVLGGTALYALAPLLPVAPVPLAVAALALVGLGLAPVYPCLVARTPSRLGTAVATHAVGFQVSAGAVGGAALPGVAGLLVQPFGLETMPRFALLAAVLLFALHEVVLAATPARPGAPA